MSAAAVLFVWNAAPSSRSLVHSKRSLRALILCAFIAVTASYSFSTWYTHHCAARAIEFARALAESQGPGVLRLAAARAQVRQIESLSDALFRSHRAVDRASIRAELEVALEQLDRSLAAYASLPRFPGERRPGVPLERARASFVASAREALAFEAGDPVTAEYRDLRDGMMAGDLALRGLLQSLIEENDAAGTRLAERIDRDHRHLFHMRCTQDLLCSLFAALCAAGVVIELKRQDAVIRENTELLQRRADELDQFAARVAHDIAGPLSGARLAIELGLRGGSPRLEQALRSVNRAHSITAGLLDFARAGARPQPGARADAGQVVESVVSDLSRDADAAGVSLVEEPMARCLVACDEGVLIAMVSNLVLNAIKFIGDRPIRRVVVRAIDRADRLRLEVEDTGPGVDLDIAPRLFEPYVRGTNTKPGLGLGLATVKRLADGHGGATGVSSCPDQGATFWFELPKARSA
jgi:nitrogen-specific signal transduction histidine kinase